MTETTHTGPHREIGIPYARAEVDDLLGYYVVCPVCGEFFAGTTKSSTKKYGLHYVKVHEAK